MKRYCGSAECEKITGQKIFQGVRIAALENLFVNEGRRRQGSEFKKIFLRLDFRRNGCSRIFDLLEQIVIVVETLALLYVIAFHGFFVQRVGLQCVTDPFGKRTIGEEDRTGNLI